MGQPESEDHSGQVLSMLDHDFSSYLIFGYLKDGRRVLLSRGGDSPASDSVNQAINLLRLQLSSENEPESDPPDEEELSD